MGLGLRPEPAAGRGPAAEWEGRVALRAAGPRVCPSDSSYQQSPVADADLETNIPANLNGHPLKHW